MLNERGGVVDDLIVYFINESWFRVVVNAGTRDKDIAWLKRFSDKFGVDIKPRTDLGDDRRARPECARQGGDADRQVRRRSAAVEDLRGS